MGYRILMSLIIVSMLALAGCSDNHGTTYSGAGAGTTGNGNTVQVGNTTNNPAPVIVVNQQ